MKILNKQDLYDILLGAAIVGTGGGGSLEEGIKIVDKALEDGCEFKLAEFGEIPDDALIGTPYSCGSISPLTEEQIAEYKKMPKINNSAEIAAVKAIEKYFNKELFGVVATELGGGNVAAALNVAARINKPIIDADPAGRSVPCLQHSTYYLKGLPIYPMSVANKFGDEVIFTKVASDERAEVLTRALAVASFNHVGVVDHLAQWKVLKNALLKDTLSMCLNIGQIARHARKENKNYAYDIIDRYNGFIMFEGTIKKADWKDKDGFTFGNIYIDGEGKFKGEELRIWYQNENIVSWKNENIFVTVPDSINIVNCSENMPLLNPHAKAGMKVTVFALRAFEEWRSEKGLQVFGPKFFGYNIKYKKVEDLLT